MVYRPTRHCIHIRQRATPLWYNAVIRRVTVFRRFLVVYRNIANVFNDVKLIFAFSPVNLLLKY